MTIKNNIREYAIVIFFILLFTLFSIIAKGFLSMTNLINVARQISLLGIVSVGMTVVILTGGIDLSVGSILGMSATLAAFSMVKLGLGMVPSVLISLVAAGVVGLSNGILITKANIPPLITTLATMTGIRGVCYIITKGIPIYGFKQEFSVLGQGYIGPIPIPVVLMILVFFLGFIVLNKMSFGRHVYGIGGNEEAAILSGIPVNKKKLIIYSASGILAGFAGIILLSRIMTGAPTLGSGFEMEVVTAVVLGGISISGGEGKLRGVIFGVMIMGILSNGLIILSVDEYYQWIIRCVVLLLAVGFDKNGKK